MKRPWALGATLAALLALVVVVPLKHLDCRSIVRVTGRLSATTSVEECQPVFVLCAPGRTLAAEWARALQSRGNLDHIPDAVIGDAAVHGVAPRRENVPLLCSGGAVAPGGVYDFYVTVSWSKWRSLVGLPIGQQSITEGEGVEWIVILLRDGSTRMQRIERGAWAELEGESVVRVVYALGDVTVTCELPD